VRYEICAGKTSGNLLPSGMFMSLYNYEYRCQPFRTIILLNEIEQRDQLKHIAPARTHG
jgi:hypothetical protein